MEQNYNLGFPRISTYLKTLKIPSKVAFIVLGVASTIWFIIRVIPEVGRADFPFVKATALWASAFVIYVITIAGSLFSLTKFRNNLKIEKYPLAALFFVMALSFSILSITNNPTDTKAADSVNWPAGLIYNPENDGVLIGHGQGVHENWNNASAKQYTRNLGTGGDIELVPVFVSSSEFTPANSELLSEKVTSIFVDSFNIKWFGTDQGISRFDGNNWDTINTSNHLSNNNVKQIAYERSSFGHEIWVATDGGLTVAAFNIDGVTSATTYTAATSGLINDTITAVGVDILHNRWIGTKAGISVFQGSKWDTLLTYSNADDVQHNLSDIIVKGIGSYDKNEQAYIATYGGGVLRYNHNDIDGFTGASTMGHPWSGLQTNNINSVRIYDTTQYFGADNGIHIHYGDNTKENWVWYSTADGLLSDNVRTVEIDNDGAIWMGTDSGLNVKLGKRWYTYDTSDGLLNPVINDIRLDFDGVIWVASNGGVQSFTQIPGRQTGGFDPIQSMNVIASDVTPVSTNITWTIGDEEKRIVFIKAGNDGLVSPQDNTTYTANTVYGEGDEVNGWYCIYNGTGNTVAVTGLAPKTMHRVMVCEYSGNAGSERYVTFEAIGNPANFTTMNTGIDQLTVNNFSIYPNPFDSYIDIKNLMNEKDSEIAIYQLDGKLRMKLSLTGSENKINTSDLNSGTYIIQINNGQSSYSYKVVKK